MSLFWMLRAEIGVYSPFSMMAHSASEAAMAEVQPKVRYFASVMMSAVGSLGWRLTRKVNRIASPQAIDPCSPIPSGFSISPRWVPGLPCTASMNSCLVFSLYSQPIVRLRVIASSSGPGGARRGAHPLRPEELYTIALREAAGKHRTVEQTKAGKANSER